MHDDEIARLSRRTLMFGLAGAGLFGCTGSGPREPDDRQAALSASPNAPAPPCPLADGPAPELVFLSALSGLYGSTTLTIYGDGLATKARYDVGRGRTPQVLLTRLAAAEVRALRDLVEGPEFLTVGPRYAQPKVKDGGLHILVGGPRRITIHSDPPDLPDVLRRAVVTVDRLREVLDAAGTDAFSASEPRILVQSHRGLYGARSFSDELTVFANGVLDYRVTQGDSPFIADEDTAYPIVRLERLATDTLLDLRLALVNPLLAVAPSFSDAPPYVRGSTIVAGTTHTIQARAPHLFWIDVGAETPLAVRPVVAALARLRARFGAPADLATVRG